MQCEEPPLPTPSILIIRLTIIMYLIFYINRTYSDYIDIMDEVEKAEHVVITDNKLKNKWCYYTLYIIKLGIQFLKKKKSKY